MRAASLLLMLLFLIVGQSAASEELFADNGKHGLFNDPVLGKFLPVNQAFQASAWRSDSSIFVRFKNAPGYYLHRHQFALESLDPSASFGELEIPPGELVIHPQLGKLYVFYDQVVLSAPIVSESEDIGSVAISVTFQGCSDEGLCYLPAQIELEAFFDSAPATVDSGNLARPSDINVMSFSGPR